MKHFGGLPCHLIKHFKSLCSVPILNKVLTFAPKSCKWIFVPARRWAKYLLLQANTKQLMSSESCWEKNGIQIQHLKYKTGIFLINKSCIRFYSSNKSGVLQLPLCEMMQIVNCGFKHILKILAKVCSISCSEIHKDNLLRENYSVVKICLGTGTGKKRKKRSWS